MPSLLAALCVESSLWEHSWKMAHVGTACGNAANPLEKLVLLTSTPGSWEQRKGRSHSCSVVRLPWSSGLHAGSCVLWGYKGMQGMGCERNPFWDLEFSQMVWQRETDLLENLPSPNCLRASQVPPGSRAEVVLWAQLEGSAKCACLGWEGRNSNDQQFTVFFFNSVVSYPLPFPTSKENLIKVPSGR